MGLVDAFRKLLAKISLLGQKQVPGCFETRLSYCFSLFFSPLYSWPTVSSSPPCLLCLAPRNINHHSLVLIIPLQDRDLWEYHFVIFITHQVCTLGKPTAQKTLQGPRLWMWHVHYYIPAPPAWDHFVTRSYSTISVSLWTRTNSKQHMLFIPTLEKKSCFLWKPMPGGVLFPRGFGNEWFFFFGPISRKKEAKWGLLHRKSVYERTWEMTETNLSMQVIRLGVQGQKGQERAETAIGNNNEDKWHLLRTLRCRCYLFTPKGPLLLSGGNVGSALLGDSPNSPDGGLTLGGNLVPKLSALALTCPRLLTTAPHLQAEPMLPEVHWSFHALRWQQTDHTSHVKLPQQGQWEQGEAGIWISWGEPRQVSLSHRLNLLQSLTQKNLFCSCG